MTRQPADYRDRVPLETPEQVLAVLRDTTPKIAQATHAVAEEALRRPPARGEWSANDVLAHLRSCADVWGECIRRIVDEDMPTIRAMNPRTWIDRTDYGDRSFAENFDAFSSQRADLLKLLESLPAPSWSCAAIVTGAGRTLERTVLSYAEWLASHERPHVKQIARTIAPR